MTKQNNTVLGWEKEFNKFYIGGGGGNICKSDSLDTRIVGFEGIRDFISQHFIAKEKLSMILEDNTDQVLGTIDYDGFAEDIIGIIKGDTK